MSGAGKGGAWHTGSWCLLEPASSAVGLGSSLLTEPTLLRGTGCSLQPGFGGLVRIIFIYKPWLQRAEV